MGDAFSIHQPCLLRAAYIEAGRNRAGAILPAVIALGPIHSMRLDGLPHCSLMWIHRDSDDSKTLSSIFFREPQDFWKDDSSRFAPCRPEMQQHDLATHLSDIHRLAANGYKLELERFRSKVEFPPSRLGSGFVWALNQLPKSDLQILGIAGGEQTNTPSHKFGAYRIIRIVFFKVGKLFLDRFARLGTSAVV